MENLRRALGKRAAGVMPGPERPFTERAGGAVGLSKIALLAVTIGGMALGLGGCASRVVERERPPMLGNTGGAWELVFESPTAAAVPIASLDRPEMSRRNDSLNIASYSPRLASDEWPSAPRPSLNLDRRIYLPRHNRDFIYFDSGSSRRYRTGRTYDPYR